MVESEDHRLYHRYLGCSPRILSALAVTSDLAMALSLTFATDMFVLTVGSIRAPIRRVESSTEIGLRFVSIGEGSFLFLRLDSIWHNDGRVNEGELISISE